MSLPEELIKVIKITRTHNKWRRFECINLIASENVMSPLAEAAYFTDMMHRYAEGKPKKRFYQGNIYTDEIELLVMDLMSRLLNVRYVEPRPISGTIANAAVFRVLGQPGDQALIAPVQAGAHVSHTKFGTLGALGIKQIELPFDLENWNIDVDKAVKIIEEVKPKFVTLGASVYLFPHPTKEIAEAAHAVGAKVVHDVAHVLGLIAGKKWPNPIHDGADVCTSSTHKTFPGPQGGVIFTDDEKPVRGYFDFGSGLGIGEYKAEGEDFDQGWSRLDVVQLRAGAGVQIILGSGWALELGAEVNGILGMGGGFLDRSDLALAGAQAGISLHRWKEK